MTDEERRSSRSASSARATSDSRKLSAQMFRYTVPHTECSMCGARGLGSVNSRSGNTA
jgi:hypothetical protein